MRRARRSGVPRGGPWRGPAGTRTPARRGARPRRGSRRRRPRAARPARMPARSPRAESAASHSGEPFRTSSIISNSVSMIGGWPSTGGSSSRELITSPLVADTTLSVDRPVARSSRTARKRRSTGAPARTSAFGGSSGAKKAKRTVSPSSPDAASAARTASTSSAVVISSAWVRDSSVVTGFLSRWGVVRGNGCSGSVSAHGRRQPLSGYATRRRPRRRTPRARRRWPSRARRSRRSGWGSSRWSATGRRSAR